MGGPPTTGRRPTATAGAATASLTALALAATLLAASPPAGASAQPGGRSALPSTGVADTSNPPDEPAPEEKAAAEARRTGVAVPVPELTTETDTVVANPDGSLGLTRSALPIRVKRAEQWVDLDATLVAGTDGRVRPSAARTDVDFSPGGTGPLATLRHDGKLLSLTWPTSLPAPQLSGPSALYSNVLPEVDLKVTATVEGGFSHVLIVKTSTAARDPRLATLALATQTDGVAVVEKPDGTLAAQTPDGQPVFTAQPAIMWDSRTAVTGNVAAATADESGVPEAGPASDPESNASRPGPGAAVAPLDVTVTAGQLVLTPDQGLMTSPDTQFPVYIDPTWVTKDRSSSLYTWVQEAYKNTPGYGRTDYNPGVGYQGFQPDLGIERSFWRVPVNLPGVIVKKANFFVTETKSAAFSCTASYPVTLYLTGVINEGTTWNNQPGTIENWGTLNVAGAGQSGCGDRLVDYNVTEQIKARAGWTDVTLGLRGDETAVYENPAFKRFGKNARLYIEYNTTPNPPTALQMSPHPPDCAWPTNLNGGWVGAVNAAGGGIKLSAQISDPDNHVVNANFHVWDATAGGVLTDYGWGPALASGSRAEQTIGTLTDGHRYDWYVRTGDYDPTTASAFVRGCSFGVDRTAPTVPTVSSAHYPPSGSSPGSSLYVNQPGTFTFASTDPGPNAGQGSGVAKFEYAVNDTIPVGNATSVTATPGANNSGTAQITFKPTWWGTNILYVQAVDKAGNRTQPRAYTFYVPFDPAFKAVAGDITGDQHPDLLLPDAAGNLRMYETRKDAAATPGTLVSLAGDAPDNNVPAANRDGKAWTTALFSHTTSTGGFTDNLWAYKAGNLRVYENTNSVNIPLDQRGPANNNGQYFSASNVVDNVPRPPAARCTNTTAICDTYWAADWSRLKQITTLSVPIPDSDPETPPFRTDLVTVEDDDGQPGGTASLWHYSGTGTIGGLWNVQRLGTGWQEYTLTAPGDATGDGMPDLWARNAANGELYQYPSAKTAEGYFDPSNLGSGSARVRIGGGLNKTDHPVVTSNGNITGSTHPDLWTSGPDGRITLFPGRAPAGGNAFDAGLPIAYNTGQCQTFPGATGGTKTLCGAILAKYLSLRDQGFPVGLPETNTAGTADGNGVWAHFRTPGATYTDASVYWHPATGAHWVQGSIRNKWQALGWENSYLGYPRSDEFTVAGGARSDFQNGYIRWAASVDTSADHTYAAGETSTAHITVTGDFNGDQRADLATVHDYQGGSAALWTSLTTDTGGAFAPFESWRTGPGNWWITQAKWVAGDFNNDGRDDIAALYRYGDGRVKLHTFTAKTDNSGGFNNPVGSWEQAAGWDWARTTLMAGNANGTGPDELVAVQGTADGRFATYTFTATATGAFNAPVKGYEETTVGNWFTDQSHFALGDANGDGRADIIGTYIYTDNTLKTFTALAGTNGTYPAFTIAGWASGPGAWWHGAIQATAGDADGGGRDDLVVMYDYGNGDMGLWTFKADTNGNLTAPTASIRTGTGNWWADRSTPHTGDTNADGRDDLITLYRYNDGGFSRFVYTANTTGGFNPKISTWSTAPGYW